MKYEQPGLLYFAQLENGQWKRSRTELPPGEEGRWVPIVGAAPPEFDPETQFCRAVPVYSVVNGEPVADWGVRPLTDADRADRREAIKAALRPQRNSLLEASDKPIWRHRDQKDAGASTTLTDEQYLEVLAYRQSLRDWPDEAETVDAVPPQKPVFLG